MKQSPECISCNSFYTIEQVIIDCIIKKKIEQWCSTIPPLSTKQTTTFGFKPLNTKHDDVLAWEWHKNVAGLKWLVESQHIKISNSNTDIDKL